MTKNVVKELIEDVNLKSYTLVLRCKLTTDLSNYFCHSYITNLQQKYFGNMLICINKKISVYFTNIKLNCVGDVPCL